MRQQAHALLHKRKDPAEYIWEVKRQVEFHRRVCANILSSDYSLKRNKDIEEYIKGIKDLAADMLKAIEEFEERVKTGRNIKEINLHAWSHSYLKDIVNSYKVATKSPDGEVTCDISLLVDIPEDLTISADEYELKQIFYNLIINSIRAINNRGVEKGIIKVTIFQTEDGKIDINITDNGIGIDERDIRKIAIEKSNLSKGKIKKMPKDELLQLIFEDWFTTREGGGQGMGIILRNVRKYNGTIKVASESGKGTTFTITSLPASGQGIEEIMRTTFEKEFGLKGKMTTLGEIFDECKPSPQLKDTPCYVVEDLKALRGLYFSGEGGRDAYITLNFILKYARHIIDYLEYSNNLPFARKGIMAVPIGFIYDKKEKRSYFVEECIKYSIMDAFHLSSPKEKDKLIKELGRFVRKLYDMNIEPRPTHFQNPEHIKIKDNDEIVVTDIRFEKRTAKTLETYNAYEEIKDNIIPNLLEYTEIKEIKRLRQIFDKAIRKNNGNKIKTRNKRRLPRQSGTCL